MKASAFCISVHYSRVQQKIATLDCECYLKALEEQADSIGGAAASMMEAVEMLRRKAESVQRTVANKVNDLNDQEG